MYNVNPMPRTLKKRRAWGLLYSNKLLLLLLLLSAVCWIEMEFICPKSSSFTVWVVDDCFNQMVVVLGFAVNLLILCYLLFATPTAPPRPPPWFWFILPCLGASLELLSFQWQLFRCSQFLVWAAVLVFSKCHDWTLLFTNKLFFFFWISTPLLHLPHLLHTVYSTSSSLKLLTLCKDSFSLLLHILFAVFVTLLRLMSPKTTNHGLEDPLLSCKADSEKTHHVDWDRSTFSYWHALTFKSVSSVMECGSTKKLDFNDLILLPIELNPLPCYSTLLSSWVVEQSINSFHPSLFRAICHAYGWSYLGIGLLKVINDCIGFAGPLLLNKLIWFLQEGSGNLDGYIFALSLGLSSIIKSFLDTQYTFRLSKLKLKLRSSIMTIIYWKCLCVSSAECSNFSEGEIQTFMSIDAERTVNLFNSLHDVWSLPLQIGLALYLLYTQVKFAFISGITLTILLIPVNKWLSTLIAKATKEMMKQKDERIRRTGDLLTNIRTLKMYAWELLFADRLKETRASEVKFLSTRKYLDAWCVFFWATTPTLFSLFTFGLFTLTGHTLNAATVFTCLALFNTLISPLNSFPWVINGLIDATISIRRLSTFLSCPEHNSERLQTDDLSAFPPSAASNKQMAVVVRDVSSVWSSSNMEQGSVLHHINLDLPKGFLIAVIGEVGSGKSSLLNAVLGEMRLIQGSIYSHGSIAYVPQVSWIISGTVRDNIILQKNYDAERYIEVLKACSLDIDISLMVGGDLAFIGEKGINLSGGQKARLALARAIYAGADVFLLDDVLSAVDAQVAYWILCKAIKGPLMRQQTRILCTHNPQAMASADMVVIMDRGHVKWTGLSAEFLTTPYATNLLLEESKRSSSCLMKEESGKNVSAEFLEISYLERVNLDIPEEARVLETETRKEGQVDLSVYKNYAKFSSWPMIIVICLSAILMQASRNGNDLWLSFWVDNTAENKKTGSSLSVSFYLMVLCIFCAINSVLTLVRAFSFAFAGLRAAVQVHSELLNKLISAPVQFFDQTPTGRILNRFSSDLYTIDDALPFILNILLANFVGLVGLFVVLSCVQVMFLILLLPFWYIYSKLQLYYRSTSRELRRLDSVSRSPIYASFTETLDGSSTIRAFKAKEYFLAGFSEHVAQYQRTSYSEITASLWLSLRLQILAAFVISFVATMAVIGSHGWFPVNFSSPGLVGLALSYAAPFVSLLSSYLASFTETEKEMVSVERLVQYMDVPQEEDIQTKGFHISNWPDQGQIDFHHVTLRYMPHLPPALRDLSFTVEGGTQVGIIGRTGAGKSSVLNALFRLTPLCAGHIIVDKVNVADVSLRELRSRIAVVPQSPFVFQGTVRDNVDPYGKKNDAIIWDVLEKCHVKELVQQGGHQLESLIKEEGGGISFSVGQRQLLCLARALLNSSKVLCLDECTANVDSETASLLQDAIGSGGSMTVITIAHRISTVMNMDKILILDHGNLVEQGNPRDLMRDQSSIFSAFARASLL